MKRLIFSAVALFLLLASTTWSQQLSTRLTNKDVIDMAALGLSDDVIISKIRSAAAGETLQFDTSVNGLKELKAAKVSDDVIKVMINPSPARRPRRRRRRAHVQRPQPSSAGGRRLLEERQRLHPHRGTGDQSGQGRRQGRQHVHLRHAQRTLGRLSQRPAIQKRHQRPSARLLPLRPRRRQRLRLRL